MHSEFHALVAGWFEDQFGAPTEPQLAGWPPILAGGDVLLAAPTGSGKTLAAFLSAIDRLFRRALDGSLANHTQVVYVSPLKALANDVHKNLELPLDGICRRALAAGSLPGAIRVAVRTGDTLAAERQAQLRRPPHILVTTPESLYLLLTAGRSRRLLAAVECVIVDEIHALAGNKRGAHLALSLSRLEHAARAAGHPRPQRIGLSATVRPLAAIAAFLSGCDPSAAAVAGAHPGAAVQPLPATIISIPRRQFPELAIEVPSTPLGPIATNEHWEERYDRIAQLAGGHRSTLVFASTRAMAERVAHRLEERLGEGAVAAHHGSLSRKIRLAAEERFKRGELRVMVATASLELGLDIGAVDLVCQLGTPRALNPALQRVGRAGHGRGRISRGCFFALTRDDLLECAALVRALERGELDRIAIPPWPRDILAQQIVATIAAGPESEADAGPPAGLANSAWRLTANHAAPGELAQNTGWSEDSLFSLVRSAWPYRDLPRAEFDAVVALLAEGVSTRRGRRGAWLHRDGVHRRLRPRRGARLAALTGVGAIPETGLYAVIAEPENLPVGTLDEDFAVESHAGDIFLLGTTSWKILGIENGRVRVENAHGAPPSVPFWLGEAPGRTPELSFAVSRLRRQIARRLEKAGPPAAAAWLERRCHLSAAAARQICDYVAESARLLGGVPTRRHFIAERFFDDGGGMQLVIHAPLGSRVNRAWGMALRKSFCRSFDFELQAAAGENGLVLSLSEQHSFPLETIFQFVSRQRAEDVLTQAVLQAPLFPTRWRWAAVRALALPRWNNGRKLPPQIVRMRAEDLLAAVFPAALGCQDNHDGDLPVPHHAYVAEAMRDCLEEALDLPRLLRALRAMEAGKIRLSTVDTPTPSGFAQEILNLAPYGYLDEAPLEERRARMVSLRASLPEEFSAGVLDPAAVAAVVEEARPAPENQEELHDLLLSLVWLPSSELRSGFAAPGGDSSATSLVAGADGLLPNWLGELRNAGRALPARSGEAAGWIAAERAALAAAIGVEVAIAQPPPSVPPFASEPVGPEPEAALAELVCGWAEILGPFTLPELASRLALPRAALEPACLRLENEGLLLRGHFRAQLSAEGPLLEFCERHLLARIHRRTLRAWRAAIEPVAPDLWLRFLLRWQRLEPGTRLHGPRGLAEVLAQLQGFEAAAPAWESELLPARIEAYQPAWLDQLCLAGEFAWARLTPPQSLSNGAGLRRVLPTRSSPLAFFARAQAAPLLAACGWNEAARRRALSPAAARVWELLARRGACFFRDLELALAHPAGPRLETETSLLKSEIELALWELVAAGLVTADDFDNLRALYDPQRRHGRGRARHVRPRHARGRWSPLGQLLPWGADLREFQPGVATPGKAEALEASPGEREAQAEFLVRRLLARYGVLFRALIEREGAALAHLRWRDLLLACRRLEARGELRGGRFISCFAGEQYALPEAVESLRAVRRLSPLAAPLHLSALDPLNLAGILLAGERVASQPGNAVTLAAAPDGPGVQFTGLPESQPLSLLR